MIQLSFCCPMWHLYGNSAEITGSCAKLPPSSAVLLFQTCVASSVHAVSYSEIQHFSFCAWAVAREVGCRQKSFCNTLCEFNLSSNLNTDFWNMEPCNGKPVTYDWRGHLNVNAEIQQSCCMKLLSTFAERLRIGKCSRTCVSLHLSVNDWICFSSTLRSKKKVVS